MRHLPRQPHAFLPLTEHRNTALTHLARARSAGSQGVLFAPTYKLELPDHNASFRPHGRHSTRITYTPNRAVNMQSSDIVRNPHLCSSLVP